MSWLLWFWILVHATDDQARALAAWDPQDLTQEKAAEHITAAWSASLLIDPIATVEGYGVVRVDPNLLLYVARHETGFNPLNRTREPGGKWSCGVMTPVPKKRCDPSKMTLVEQYMEGGENLRSWYAHCRDHKYEKSSRRAWKDRSFHHRCALLGYAGGVPLIRACRHRNTLWRWRGAGLERRRVDLCSTWQLYRDGAQELAGRIQKEVP